MEEQIKTQIFDKLNNIKHLPVCIYRNFMGEENCNDFKNLIIQYKKSKVKRMDLYEPYQDVLKMKKGRTTQVVRVVNKEDGKAIDPTDVLNGEYSNVSAWCSSYHTHKKTDLFEKYQSHLANYCQNFYNNYFSENLQFQINELWIADYEKGDYAVKHNHDKFSVNFISACYYIDIEEDASPIIFEGEEPIYPEKDMLILFSSKTYHEVPPTNGKRLLISFNLENTTKHEPTIEDYLEIVNIAVNNKTN